MSQTSFFARNKAAIAVSVLAGAGIVGGYFYYSSQKAQAGGDAQKKRKNKKKKQNNQKEQATPEKEGEVDLKEVPFPLNEKGLPAFSEDAVSELTEEQKEEWALALKKLGNQKYKNEEYEPAIEFYTAALKVKTDPVFYSNRSACYSALNKHEEVVQDATEAIKLKPDYTKCILRRATSLEALERYPDAMFDLTALTVYGAFNSKLVESTLEKVLQKHLMKIVEEQIKNRVPELPSALTIASFFGAFVSEANPEGVSENSEGADKTLYDAVTALNSKIASKYDEADELFKKAVADYNVDSLTSKSDAAKKATVALEYAAAMSFLKNDRDSIDQYINKAMDLAPRARTYVMRALVKADVSTLEDALANFAKAEKIDPKNPDVYYHWGQIHYLTGSFPKAEELFSKAKELNPENVFAYIQLACVIYKKGEFEEAIKAFDEARLKFPTLPEVLNYYGEILADRLDIKGAIKQYEIAIRLQEALLPVVSVGAAPLINKGALLQRDGLDDMAEVADLFQKAVDLDPKSELARAHLAQVKLAQDKPEEAILLFEEGSLLARTFDEKVQATSFAEATKMQLRIKADPNLTAKINELISAHASQAMR